MELTDLRENLFRLFEISDIEALGNALYNACINNDIEKYQSFCEFVPDLNSDWLQRVWQYHLADRKEKKQDFTPRSLAMLLAELTDNGGDNIDLCAGTGALTIQAWVKNPDRHFECYELDNNLIPFLLFNLAVRNMDATVYNGDCLTMKFEKIYRIIKGEKFGTISIEKSECDKQSTIQHKVEADLLSFFG